MSYKKCCKCNEQKNVDEFQIRKNGVLSYRCKACDSVYAKEYYQKNKDKIKNKTAAYRKNKPEYMKQYRRDNHDKITVSKRKWIDKNRDKLNKRERERRKTDIEYKIKKNLRRRVNQVITKGTKSDSTLKLLGCNLLELTKHLEKQFTKGMSWQNYGTWHIDHIKPCASFDLTQESEQKKCFHYSNLQPLWAEDNLRKGDRY